MNNALNAKLSKLIYALASDDPEYLSNKAGAFDRLLLLVRELYRMLDETEGLKQLVFRLYYGKHYGLIKLDAASPNDDAGALRLKRWMVYSRIAERIEKCGKHLSVVLEDVVLENGADKSHYIDKANVIIERFGLVRDEAALSAIEAEEVLKTEQELQATSEPQKSAPKHHGNMHQIRMQEKIENYSAMQKVASMQISRMRFIFPHIK
ncbi:hypothetical protein HMPREF3047_08700 [Neisseria sp. HMSC075C10]|uniref:hypothetical protein n=1 Tax=unclassified Neisseria TaxID=2623750 RepID=UPI0008A1B763|nr:MULTISPECIES: hypothetical protein [unclassified Neisseria]OFO37963.1 hypothetical protein HMPREF3047_08700 [Neisseria sp. HMSC075C10]OHQ58885.1 hypothetical protein HMPREF2606_04440 [Neisseria sp. HMSC070H10]